MQKTMHSPKPFQTVVMLLVLLSIVTPGITAATRDQDPPKAENVKVIPDGTEFTVVTIDEITSKTAAEGDPLTFKVAQDVRIDGQMVIAKDTLVKGVVGQAKKAGMMGRGGSLGIRVESAMTVDNQKLKLRSTKGKEAMTRPAPQWRWLCFLVHWVF